jgi:SAM-dependent methyltransferase
MMPIIGGFLRQTWRRQLFAPGVISVFIHPFYFARRGLYANIAQLAPQLSGRTLDVGCGIKPYQSLTNASEYIGLEIDSVEGQAGSAADVYYDGTTFPFDDQSFDSLLINQVFEHVFNPEDFLGEVNRVTKTGGLVLITVPFVWDEHLQPLDYARYSSFGLRHVLETHGFKVVDFRKSMNDVRAIFQLINAYTYKKTLSNSRYLNVLVTIVLMAPVNLLGEALGWLLPRNDDFYLDNVVLARKIRSTSVDR